MGPTRTPLSSLRADGDATHGAMSLAACRHEEEALWTNKMAPLKPSNYSLKLAVLPILFSISLSCKLRPPLLLPFRVHPARYNPIYRCIVDPISPLSSPHCAESSQSFYPTALPSDILTIEGKFSCFGVPRRLILV